jgi:hypothetical protein
VRTRAPGHPAAGASIPRSPATGCSLIRIAVLLRELAVVALVAAAVPALAGAPLSTEEVQRRMSEGTERSAVCLLEARVNREVSGEHCTGFLSWIEHDFPDIAAALRHTTPRAVELFETYLANLAEIVAIAEARGTHDAPTGQ